jgi:hypothetical protein
MSASTILGWVLCEHCDGFLVGSRRRDNTMAEALDHLLNIHRYQRFVFDDEDVCGHLPRNFVRRLHQQRVKLIICHIEHLRSFRVRKPFHRHQDEGLARLRRN